MLAYPNGMERTSSITRPKYPFDCLLSGIQVGTEDRLERSRSHCLRSLSNRILRTSDGDEISTRFRMHQQCVGAQLSTQTITSYVCYQNNYLQVAHGLLHLHQIESTKS
ncbi:hypothetical protein M405DRAFT_96965 [Rhizopogon salebrosus TDB-379]|nr:hypothetical protein M405DRAFT_26427 [Rhizopogon salebrosus TDB-379]KAJ8591691.1 hypothetical protein M405DRAFT_96965 [Rhizopogon salebrosus TDB-379]